MVQKHTDQIVPRNQLLHPIGDGEIFFRMIYVLQKSRAVVIKHPDNPFADGVPAIHSGIHRQIAALRMSPHVQPAFRPRRHGVEIRHRVRLRGNFLEIGHFEILFPTQQSKIGAAKTHVSLSVGQKTGDCGKLLDNAVIGYRPIISQLHVAEAGAGKQQSPKLFVRPRIHRVYDQSV